MDSSPWGCLWVETESGPVASHFWSSLLGYRQEPSVPHLTYQPGSHLDTQEMGARRWEWGRFSKEESLQAGLPLSREPETLKRNSHISLAPLGGRVLVGSFPL